MAILLLTGGKSSQLKSEEWADIQADLEDKLGEAQSLNQSLHSELEKLRAVNGNSQISRDQQRQTNSVIQGDESELRMQYEALQRLHEQLKMDLQDQQQVFLLISSRAVSFLLANLVWEGCQVHHVTVWLGL